MFPQGLPGIGLILLRAAAAIPLLQQTVAGLQNGTPPGAVGVVAGVAALLLLIGLWTPIAGVVLALVELALSISHPAERWPYVQVAAVSAAVAMLGPGAWSVDARLFGRKNIEIPERS